MSGRCKIAKASVGVSLGLRTNSASFYSPFLVDPSTFHHTVSTKKQIAMGATKSIYNGDVLNYSPARSYDFSRSYAVVVSGDTFNPCGHMLLNAGGRGGWYFHIAERKGYPRYMGQTGYERYLRENGKTEISRTFVPLRYPQRSMAKLVDLLSMQWSWWLLPNNCASFVEDVLQAGGTSAGLITNCPSREVFR